MLLTLTSIKSSPPFTDRESHFLPWRGRKSEVALVTHTEAHKRTLQDRPSVLLSAALKRLYRPLRRIECKLKLSQSGDRQRFVSAALIQKDYLRGGVVFVTP